MAEQQDKDQRTEQATPARIRKAREEGQVGYSAEFVGGLVLATGVLWFWGVGSYLFGAIQDSAKTRLTLFDDVVDDPRGLVGALIADTQLIGLPGLSLMIAIVVVVLAAGLLQTSFNISFKPLNLNWEKVSVASGMKRIFAWKSVVRGALSVVKASVILAVVFLLVRSDYDQISYAGFGSLAGMFSMLGQLLAKTALLVAALMFVVGVVDLAYQKWNHMQELRMSLKDIKDENKETEGDPLMRARIKRLQAELGRKRMLADVPTADVIITNPTHFAVALKYDRKTMDAPRVVAKGADFLAKRIIEIAKENGVEVMERKPVARFLYSNVEVGNEIPVELYQAVAEILNYVNRMRSAA